jgi:hypothetical protein
MLDAAVVSVSAAEPITGTTGVVVGMAVVVDGVELESVLDFVLEFVSVI